MIRCQGTLPPTFGTRNGWPNETRVRCHRTLGVQTWQGSHGQMMVACPQHRKQVEALDAPYRPDPDFQHRLRAEMEEGYRDAMMDSGRGGLLRG